MISIQSSISLKESKTFSNFENSSEDSSKKRKWHSEEDYLKKAKDSEAKPTESILDIDLHLERPLPIDWQRCLDLQSGQIHFYNTRTHKRTCRDPRRSPQHLSSRTRSLDLELNLLHGDNEEGEKHEPDSPPRDSNDFSKDSSLSWVSLEADQQEMVAAVCMRCHMLVMLCKSSPACPHCKFMHPPNQNPFTIFQPNSSLLCCKD